jgi:hypothetical protein
MQTVKKARSSDWNYGGGKWRLSRSKIDVFMECRRCFYLDNKLGIARPRGPSFTLNVAVDALLKREFDIHRANKSAHPFMEKYGIDAVPFDHPDLATWRENFDGVEHVDEVSGMTICGAIDDVWINPKGELIVVDYKATSKEDGPSSVDDLYPSYKRQMEVYQWLFRKNGFAVSPTAYFVYVNGRSDAKAFDAKLEFDVVLIPYTGTDAWIEPMLIEVKKTLDSTELPPIGTGFGGGPCDFCAYRELAGKTLLEHVKKYKPKK